MRMHKLFLGVFISWLGTTATFAQAPLITPADIKLLNGNWLGTLTYLDYSTGKPYTMPSQVVISSIANSRQLIFSNVYPNEPKANNADTVTVSADGSRIDNELVKRRTVLPNGNIQLVTEYAGMDGNDNKPAVIRTTYTFGKTLFEKRKEVQFAGESVWIKRHEYNYKRQ